MMHREAKVVALVLFLACLLAVCVAKGAQITCRPSSCGEIRNISYPFRLQSDPSGCGDSHYELVCENNRTVTNLPIFGGFDNDTLRYYVAHIDYERHTIRVVYPGVEKGNCFTTPLYSLIRNMIRDSTPFHLNWKRVTNTTVLLKCEQPISDGNYIPISPCRSRNLTSSSSQPYVYALVGGDSMVVGDIKYSCTVDMNIMIRKLMKPNNLSMLDLQEAMLMGLDLSFSLPKKLTVLQIIFKALKTEVDAIVRLLRVDKLIRQLNGGEIGVSYPLEVLLDVIVAIWTILMSIVRTALGILCLLAYLIYKFQRRHLSFDDSIEEFLLNHQNLQLIKYSYSEIKRMTHNFKHKLGQGGFGTVYKGKLRSGHIVAVKILIMSKANGQDFINEVATIGRIHHINVVRLVGFCIERSKWALIYDFMPYGSLDRFVFHDQGNNNSLSWEELYKIALGVGNGIKYLHQGCDMQILHFDIKPHNILLDKGFTPKISDFGLAKLYPTDKSIVSITAARGTLGYMAPELFYKNIGGVSFKADVYSFGMLLLEMVGRRKNLNAFAEHSSQIYFPTWIYDKYDQGEDMEIGDASEDERKCVKKMVIVALWCIQMKPMDRPSMSEALEMLEGEVELLKVPPKPTHCPIEMPLQNHEQPMTMVPISSFNSAGTITFDGR